MELPLKVFLYLHIACGGTALLTGLIALLTFKGGKVHRKAGKVFFYAMIGIAISALVISIAKNNSFLLAIAVFSFYMNYTGYRALKNRKVRYKWFDWLALIASAAVVIYMFISLNIVLVVFGALLTFFIVQDVLTQLKPDEQLKQVAKERVITHLGRMSGTYIATVTAFAVVNINFVNPGWLVWLLPTFVGVPVIVYFTRVWRKKLNA